MVLSKQGKCEEALKIFNEVLGKKKMLLGMKHTDTLRTLCNIAGILLQTKKYDESLKAYVEVLSIQKSVLGSNHPETLKSQYNMANVLFADGKWIGAFRAYKEGLSQMETVFGSNHPFVLDALKKIEVINLKFKLEGDNESDILQFLQKDINIVVSKGDIVTLESLLNNGVDVNDKDVDGRTPLHYAAGYGQTSIVNLLLEKGADVTEVTNKGNTPLHTATAKGYKDIVECMLKHISCGKLNQVINAKTMSSGTTALHVAAEKGFLEIVMCLLKHGAIFNIKNVEGKTPVSVSKDHEVTNFLNLVEELFEGTKWRNVKVINKLSDINHDEFLAVSGARNDEEKTLLQVAIMNGYKNIAELLLKMLKK